MSWVRSPCTDNSSLQCCEFQKFQSAATCVFWVLSPPCCCRSRKMKSCRTAKHFEATAPTGRESKKISPLVFLKACTWQIYVGNIKVGGKWLWSQLAGWLQEIWPCQKKRHMNLWMWAHASKWTQFLSWDVETLCSTIIQVVDEHCDILELCSTF